MKFFSFFSNLGFFGTKPKQPRHTQSSSVRSLAPTAKPTPTQDSAPKRVLQPGRNSPSARATGEFATTGVPQSASLQYHENRIDADKDWSLVFIHALLSEELKLTTSIQSQICPIQTDASKGNCVLLVTESYQGTPEVNEVIKLMREKGYELRTGVNAYLISVQLLLSLSRGDITAQSLNVRRNISANPKQSRLWDGFKDVISWAHERGAADVHYCIKMTQEYSQINFTIDGKYVGPAAYKIPTATLLDQLGLAWQHGAGGNGSGFDLMIEQNCQILVDLPSGKRVMLRWSSMAADQGPSVTLRILDLDVELKSQSLADLGYLPYHVEAMTRSMHSEGGAIILSGVMASGKSTTLATIAANMSPTKKGVSLESPVEYIIPNFIQNSFVSDTPQLSEKIRAIKRSGGHAFLLGEIRDKETGMAYQDLTESGLDLLTTTHAGRHINIPNRLSSPFIGVAREVLATPGNMKLLVSQALLPINCVNCKLPASALFDPAWFEGAAARENNTRYLKRINDLYGVDIDKVFIRNHVGCPTCRKEGMPSLNGLKGRTVAAEIFEPTDEYLSLVKVADYLGVDRYYEGLTKSPFLSPEMYGKSAMDCAIYKMSLGLIDPREIEPRFMSFETVELRRKQRIQK